MSEFKVGDKVELTEFIPGAPEVGTVGVVTGMLKSDGEIQWNHLKVKFESGLKLISSVRHFKKVGEVRPNLPNREEYINQVYGEWPKSNVEKVFEMLGVKPYERFEITSESRCFEFEKYFIDEKLKVFGAGAEVAGIVSFPDIQTFILEPELIKTLPPKLLTDEEEKILKPLKFDYLIKYGNFLELGNSREYSNICFKIFGSDFIGLEAEKKYTKEELGL